MDLVDRSGERSRGSSGCAGSGGDRGGASEVAGAPATPGDPEAGDAAGQRGYSRLSRNEGVQVVAAGGCDFRRTTPAYGDRQAAEGQTSRAVQELLAVEGIRRDAARATLADRPCAAKDADQAGRGPSADPTIPTGLVGLRRA